MTLQTHLKPGSVVTLITLIVARLILVSLLVSDHPRLPVTLVVTQVALELLKLFMNEGVFVYILLLCVLIRTERARIKHGSCFLPCHHLDVGFALD